MREKKFKYRSHQDLDKLEALDEPRKLVILPSQSSFAKIHDRFLKSRGKQNDTRRYKA